MTSAFISYSRHNEPFAQRFHLDLKRTGIDAWLDRSGIPFDSPQWEQTIRESIEGADYFLLLASPESAWKSLPVRKELATAEALGKPIVTLLIGGEGDKLPDDWRARQITDFRDGYGRCLSALLRQLNGTIPPPASLTDLLARNGQRLTVSAAADELTGAEVLHVAGREYRNLPVEPSGYTMTWLVAPADAVLFPPARLAVLLKFTGPPTRGETAEDVIGFLSAGQSGDVWVVYVRGPRSAEGRYELPLDSPHIWEDGARAAARAMHLPFVRGKELHLFLESPATLVYAVAGQLREMGRHHLYQLDYQPAGADRYRRVLGSKLG